MTFIITLISLIIERFFHWTHLRHWRWFGKYQQWLSTTRVANMSSFILLIICVLPPILVVGMINHLLRGWAYGIPQLIFGIVVLLYCMGPENLWAQAFACLNGFNQEDPRIGVERAQTAFNVPTMNTAQEFHQALTTSFFIKAHQRIFAVIFWFVLLGPLGAVLYRSIALCSEQSNLGLTQSALRVRQILDWLPARLFTFMFALGGHFNDVFTVWRRDAKQDLSSNDKLIADCGLAALDGTKAQPFPEGGISEKAALELIDRVFVIGLVILAMTVIMIK